MHALSWERDTEIIKFLIDKGANVNSLTSFGYAPIHYVCWYYSGSEILKLLIKNGSGKQPIDIAKDNQDNAIIELLK